MPVWCQKSHEWVENFLLVAASYINGAVLMVDSGLSIQNN